MTRQGINIRKHLSYVFAAITISCLVLGIYGAADWHHVEYFSVVFRLVSILFNICIYVLISIRTQTVRRLTLSNASSVASSTVNFAIVELTSRLKYYSFVLIISRLFSSWYELQYNFDSSNEHPSTASNLQNFVFIMHYTLTPSAGIGYLVVFLVFQPTARSKLNDMIFGTCMLAKSSNPLPPGRAMSSENQFKSNLNLTSVDLDRNSQQFTEMVGRDSSYNCLTPNYDDMDDDELILQIQVSSTSLLTPLTNRHSHSHVEKL